MRFILTFVFIFYLYVITLFPRTLVKKEIVDKQITITLISDSPEYIYNNGLVAGIKPIEGLSSTYINGYSVPIYVEVFNALPDNIMLNVEKKNLNIVNVDNLYSPSREYCIDGDNIIVTNGEIVNNELNVYKEFKGYYNDFPITAVYIIPFIIDFYRGRVKYFRDLKVTIRLINGGKKLLPTELNDKMLLGIFGNVKKIHDFKIRHKTLGKAIGHSIIVGIKLVINEDGIYRIYGRDLKKIGVNISQINPLNFHLKNKNEELPIYVKGYEDSKFNVSDYIEFFAEMNKNDTKRYFYDPFTNKNVYWLYWDEKPGLRYATEDVSLNRKFGDAIVPQNFQYTYHFEENNVFHQLGYVDTDRSSYERDHWFFDYGIMGGSISSYNFKLIYPDTKVTNNFSLKACFYGLTKQDDLNKLKIYINGIKAAEGQWKGQGEFIVSSRSDLILSNRYLNHGQNTIQIISELENQLTSYSKVLFDWLDIKYLREYKAFNDEIIFKKPENFPNGLYHFKVEGFNSPDISLYEINKIRLNNFETRRDPNNDRFYILFEDYIGSDSIGYYAAGKSAIKYPVLMTKDTIGLAMNSDQGDIIIISSNEYLGNIKRLVNFYSALGYTPVTISIKNIYNDFNYGIISPHAIKKFLSYATDNWTIKPKYLIIIGDSKIKEEESVPTYFFQSYKYGACASDYWYSLIDTDDIIPDLIVGRIPCRNKEELDAYIQKRISYEGNKLNVPWRNSVLFISGGLDAFNQQVDYITEDVIDKNTFVDKLKCIPTQDFTDSLSYKMNKAGYNIINFFGHGGGAIWSDRSLMTIEDVDKLNNLNMLPIITSMTCFTGDFAGLNRLSLGEKMVMYENGGAIVFIGSSSVGWVINDFLFIKEFYKRIKDGYTVGEAINLAKIGYYINNINFSYLTRSIIYSYNLLGDPTVTIRFPSEEKAINILNGGSYGDDSVKFIPNNQEEINKIYCQLYGDSRDAIYKNIIVLRKDNNGLFKLDIPNFYKGQNLLLTYLIPSEPGGQSGHATLWRKEVDFESFTVTPATPEKGDSIYIKVNVTGENIDSVLCLVDTLNTVVYTNEYGLEVISGFNDGSIIKKLNMLYSINEGKWVTNEALILSKLGKIIGVKFVAYKNGNKFESQIYTFKTDEGVDLSILDLELGLGKLPLLRSKIHYSGDKAIKAMVLFSEIVDNKSIVLDSCIVKFCKTGDYYCDIKRILGFGVKKIVAEIDVKNQIKEINESNNKIIKNLQVNVFPLLPGIGSTIDGKNHAVISLDSILFIDFAGNDVLDSNSFSIDILTGLSNKIFNQPDFNPICDTLWHVSLWNKNSIGAIHLRYDYKNRDISLCKYNTKFQKWYVMNCQDEVVDSILYDKNSFALFSINDRKIPSIEVNSEGKDIYNDSYVSPNSNLSIILEDDNGLIGGGDFLKLSINDAKIDTGSIHIIDYVPSENKLVLKLNPQYYVGINNLNIITKDVAGNTNEVMLRYKVEKDLKLFDYGNYPNPFQKETYFIYELTQDVESINIKIFTVAGRSIRIIRSGVDMLGINLAGYHEVKWDGKDDRGDYIANGVYFYKIVAKKSGKKLISKGKIAKIR